MANPTTNYGFVLPTPTDLVTDLPADFDVALQGVDTQMLTNANAAIAKTIVDAKGDIIAATGADAVSRLAVGANATVLTADSAAATGLKWAAPAVSASGMTLVQRSTYSNVANTGTTFDGVFTSTYKNYLMVIEQSYASVGGFVNLNWRVAGATQSAATYNYQNGFFSGNAPTSANGRFTGASQTGGLMLENDTSSTATSNATFNINGVAIANGFPWLNGFMNTRNAGVGTMSQINYRTAINADGFILTPVSGTIYGTISIYGLAI